MLLFWAKTRPYLSKRYFFLISSISSNWFSYTQQKEKNMLKRLFIDHPKSVNETYIHHFFTSISFSMKLFKAAIACFIHALVPGLCIKTGSKAITELHVKMVTFRVKGSSKATSNTQVEAAIEYMI
jgi:uncharacterized membrane protein YjjP (DUF1212 family)